MVRQRECILQISDTLMLFEIKCLLQLEMRGEVVILLSFLVIRSMHSTIERIRMGHGNEACFASVDRLAQWSSDSVRRRTECNPEGFHEHRFDSMSVRCESVPKNSSADWQRCPTVNDGCSSTRIVQPEPSRWRYQSETYRWGQRLCVSLGAIHRLSFAANTVRDCLSWPMLRHAWGS